MRRLRLLLLPLAIACCVPHVASAQFFIFDDPPPRKKKVAKPSKPKPPVDTPIEQAAKPKPEVATGASQLTGAPAGKPAAASTTAHQMPPPPAPANCRNSGDFNGWLAAFKKEAAAEGISKRVIHAILDGMTLDTSVIARDRRQSFFAQTFFDFSAKLATNGRMQSGIRQVARHQADFARAEKEYGVPAPVITAFWALESDYGAGMGKLPILRALTTLAYDCRRGAMFREELKSALRIIERGDLTPDEMIGSWAGELGQTQFLPGHYLNYAVDYDGDGRRDLIRSESDVIGSTAHFLQSLGWRGGEPWIQEVKVPAELPWDQADLAIMHPVSQWSKWGVTGLDGGALSHQDLPASLILPMGRNGPGFLAYSNFQVYLKWNQSLNYALTAAYLATRIGGAPPMRRNNAIPALSFEQVKELQTLLIRRGYLTGEVDGKVGADTRAAVKTAQQKLGMPADSYPTPGLLDALRSSG